MYKLEKKLGKYAIKNLSMVLIVCYAVGYLIQQVNSNVFYGLTLDPYKILHGEVWRIFTWILIPPDTSNIFFVLITLLFYYSIGTTLERTWGTFQYNFYIFSGMLFTILGAFATYLICYYFKDIVVASAQFENIKMNITTRIAGPEFMSSIVSRYISTYYINMSIFLAFAATFPNSEVLLMFILPIKVKWLGFVYAGVLVINIIQGEPAQGFVIASSLLNFVLFFFTTRRVIKSPSQIRRKREFVRSINEARKSGPSGVTKHKCAICGRTEKDGDDLVFRFCSKCEGNYEFCQEHLYTHKHFVADDTFKYQ